MSAVYFGQYTVAGSVPGIDAQLSTLLLAMRSLSGVVSAQLSAVASAAAAIDAEASAVLSAKVAIRIPAIVDFQLQANAAAAIAAGFSVQLSDPSLYISALVEGLAEVSVNINALIPSVAVQAQLDASLGVELAANLKITAVDLQLGLLDTISAALKLVVSAVLSIQAALSIAVSAAVNVIASIAAYLASLDAAGGVHAFLYDGALSGLGAAIDLVTPSTGIAGGTSVHCPIVLTQASNASGVSAMDRVYRVSA